MIRTRCGISVPAKPTDDDEEYPATHPDDVEEDPFEEYEDEDEFPRVIPEIDDPIDVAGNAINQQPVYDKTIQAELILPQ